MLTKLLRPCAVRVHLVQTAGIQSKYWQEPIVYDPHNVPYGTNRRLKRVQKEPIKPMFGAKHIKMPSRSPADIRGTERVHNQLIHKQFGIQALSGGKLLHGHFTMMTKSINRELDEKRMFAVWRIDPPWKPATKKPQGARMGGGKGAIHHFFTPVKAQRILFEVGGECEWHHVYPFLKKIAAKMPFEARAVSHDILLNDAEQAKLLNEHNINPFTLDYIIKNNMFGCQLWVSKYWKQDAKLEN